MKDPVVLVVSAMAAFAFLMAAIDFAWIARIAARKRMEVEKKKPRREPIPGEVWHFSDNKGDPFPRKEGWTARVIDVKDGWVRYYLNFGFPDNRMELRTFVQLYDPPASSDAGQ